MIRYESVITALIRMIAISTRPARNVKNPAGVKAAMPRKIATQPIQLRQGAVPHHRDSHYEQERRQRRDPVPVQASSSVPMGPADCGT